MSQDQNYLTDEGINDAKEDPEAVAGGMISDWPTDLISVSRASCSVFRDPSHLFKSGPESQIRWFSFNKQQ